MTRGERPSARVRGSTIFRDARIGDVLDRIKKVRFEILLLLIVFYALVYSIVFVGGPSFYGDDTTYLELASSVLQGSFIQSGYIFSVRILMVLPIAIFYKLFGVSLLSSSAWDITTYLLSIIIAFYLGKELYNKYAGVVAALLLTFFPLVNTLSATISDDIPMMFVVSSVMLSLLYATRKKSRFWYFVTGGLLVASPLVTPEGVIAVMVSFVYLAIEFARGKVAIEKKTTFYLAYGLIAAGILLMIFNFSTSGNPLITLTTNSHFYSAVGTQGTIPSTNTDPLFYPDTMFPYDLSRIFANNIISLDLNPLSIWNQINVINYNVVGFYFYFFVLATIYLLVRREKRSYYIIFWFFASFLYLEFGPMHISLNPFVYLMSYRLQRFLTFIAVPTVVTIGIASASMIEKGPRVKMYAGVVISLASILFLILSSIPINTMWFTILTLERYDQIAIANYIMQLPNTTRIFTASAFSSVPIYIGFNNLNRISAYDAIPSCKLIPNNTYVIMPKYNQMFNLNYTPNPLPYCPSWRLVLYPQISGSYPDYMVAIAKAFGATLYYAPGKYIPSNVAHNLTPTTTIPPTTTINANTTVGGFNYFNLTGVGFFNSTTRTLQGFVVINNVTGVNVTLNKSSAHVGEYVNLNVSFIGSFRWYGNPATNYYLGSPLINVHYYGVEYANQSGKLLDQNNGPWYNFVGQIGEPHQLLTAVPNSMLLVRWIITPTSNMTGKTIKICGGYYATYQNTTLGGGWGSLYDILSGAQTHVVNRSVINIPSAQCQLLRVY